MHKKRLIVDRTHPVLVRAVLQKSTTNLTSIIVSSYDSYLLQIRSRFRDLIISLNLNVGDLESYMVLLNEIEWLILIRVSNQDAIIEQQPGCI